MGEEYFEIKSFAKGLNEYSTETLVEQDEAVSLRNVIIENGSLKVEGLELWKFSTPNGSEINRVIEYFLSDETKLLFQSEYKLYDYNGELFATLNNPGEMDYINFLYKGERVLIGINGNSPFMINSAGKVTFLMDRRPVYKEDGTLDYYTNALGQRLTEEQAKETKAPAGDLIELFQDRLWIARSSNYYPSDRIYFSTSGVNGADIHDWQIPIEEAEANQHGGFIDVRSYDGSGIIGLKTAFDSLYIFKRNSIYKIVGTTPDDFQVIQVSESNGAIADRSIAVGNNSIFYLSTNGIFSFDGTNSHLISSKVKKSLSKFRGYSADMVCSLYHNRKYYLSIPIDIYTSSERSFLFVYDTDLKSYTIHEYDGLIKDIKILDNEVSIAIGDSVKGIMTKGFLFSKPMHWESPYYDFGVPNSKKNTTYIYFRGRGLDLDDWGDPSVVRFTLTSDKKVKYIDVPLTAENVIYKKKLKNKGRYFKLEITNPNDCYFEIENVRLIAEIDVD